MTKWVTTKIGARKRPPFLREDLLVGFADFQEQYLADPKWLAKQNFHNSAEEAYTG